MLADFIDATHDPKLSHFINGVDMVNPLLFVQIPLMYRVNAEVAGLLAIGLRLAAFADLRDPGPGLFKVTPSASAGRGLSQSVSWRSSIAASILLGIPWFEAGHGALAALESACLAVPGNQPGELLTGVAAVLPPVADHHPFSLVRQRQVAELDQLPLNPAVAVVLVTDDRKDHRPGA